MPFFNQHENAQKQKPVYVHVYVARYAYIRNLANLARLVKKARLQSCYVQEYPFLSPWKHQQKRTTNNCLTELCVYHQCLWCLYTRYIFIVKMAPYCQKFVCKLEIDSHPLTLKPCHFRFENILHAYLYLCTFISLSYNNGWQVLIMTPILICITSSFRISPLYIWTISWIY